MKNSTPKMGRFSCLHGLVLSAALCSAQIAMAGEIRMADGKPCHPTERTFYAEDGATPYQCEAAGGPAYRFEVYDGENLLWKGELPPHEPEVYFEFQEKLSEKDFSRLLVKRDLNADPQGRVVFFGEQHVQRVDTLESANGTLMKMPVLQKVGFSIPVKESRELKLSAVAGAKTDFSRLRLTISPSS